MDELPCDGAAILTSLVEYTFFGIRRHTTMSFYTGFEALLEAFKFTFCFGFVLNRQLALLRGLLILLFGIADFELYSVHFRFIRAIFIGYA